MQSLDLLIVEVRVQLDGVDPHLLDQEVLLLDPLKQALLLSFLPLLGLADLAGFFLSQLLVSLPLYKLLLSILDGLPQQLVLLRLGNQLLRLLIVPLLRFKALVDDPGELLDVFHLLLVQVLDLLDDLERPMALTEDAESLLLDALPLLLLNLHIVVGALSALDMEVDVAVSLVALH